MREIKFRQYWQHEDIGVISTSEWTLDRLKQGITGVDRHNLIAEVQFTGLRDESFSKVEVYEGDLFGKSDSNGVEVYGEVYFDTDFAGFCVRYPNGGWTTLGEHLLNKQNYREVIGNIYENPELLKSETQETM